MKRLSFFAITVFIGIIAQAQNTLVWSDEFNGTELDTNNWSYELGNGCPSFCGWGNNELQTYTNSTQNIKVQNGNLIISAVNTGGNWTSARIRSLNKFDFCLGTVEVRAKVPAGKGFWPAAWFLPSEKYYGTWPLSGEIDLMESRGQEPEITIGTIHYGPLSPNNQYNGNEYTDPNGTFAEDFHVFSVEWSQESIIWKVDGVQFSEKTLEDVGDFRWPFDRNFHALLNCAVGGNFLGNPDGTTPSIGNYEIDYIRVYQNPNNIIISGPEAIIRGNDTHKFYTQELPGYSINWIAPSGAQILSGQGTKEVNVQWGFSSGEIQAVLSSNAESTTLSHFVQVIPDSCSEVFDDRSEFIRLFWVGGDGGFDASAQNPLVNSVNPSQEVSRYERNAGSQYDVLQFSNDLIKNAIPFENSSYKIEVLVYSSAPIGTEIQILFEKRELLSQAYPTGRRTILNANTTSVNAWELLTFNFVITPDVGLSPTEINQLTVLVAPNSNTNPVVYFDNWAIKEVPCLVASNVSVDSDNSNLKVYPNPFSSNVTLVSSEKANYSISDLTGKALMLNSNLKDAQNYLNSNLPKGVYFITEHTVNSVNTQKIIRQ